MDASAPPLPHHSSSTEPGLAVCVVSRLAGVLSIALGSAVLIGWATRTRSLTNLHPALPPMQVNTAVSFILCGVGYLSMIGRRSWLTRACGTAAMLIGFLTFTEYVTGLNLGIDDLILDQSPDPNRMAPNTAISFSLIGGSIILASTPRFGICNPICRAFLSSAVLIVGLASLIGYLASIETAYGWGRLTQMSLHTASGFVALGSAGVFVSIQVSRLNHVGQSIRWAPWTAAFSIWVFAILMWQALQAAHNNLNLPEGQTSTYSVLSWVLLIGGLLLGWLFQLSLSRSAIAEAEIVVRVNVENQLREVLQELQLQKFALDQHSIVAITDPRGVITMANDKFCEISGYTREEIIGQTHRIINSGTHPKSFFTELWKTITAGQTWHGEICNRAKDGSLYWVDTTIVPFVDSNGKTTQYVSIRTDVSEHKLAESKIMSINDELRSKNAEMEQFAYTVSHDLKSPTVTIRGYVGFLKQDIDREKYDRVDGFVDSIIRATEKMRCTIDDLLELSRIGRVTHDLTTVDLEGLVRLVVTEMSPQCEQIGAVITVDDELPPIHGDRVRIEQVLQNLISNAFKYAHCDERTLRINVSARIEGGMVQLCVADNGPGVEPEFAEKVFGLFERLKSGPDGTGIGLAIVRRITELHGGRAWVEEAPGGGAAFIATFPCVQSGQDSGLSTSNGALSR